MQNTKCPNCGQECQTLDIEFNYESGVVKLAGRTVYLRPRMIDILECLVDAYPAAVSVQAILESPAFTTENEAKATPNFIIQEVLRMRSELSKSRLPLRIVRIHDGKAYGYLLSPGTAPLVAHQHVA
jgi:DNA-binding response OmpR family regulator